MRVGDKGFFVVSRKPPPLLPRPISIFVLLVSRPPACFPCRTSPPNVVVSGKSLLSVILCTARHSRNITNALTKNNMVAKIVRLTPLNITTSTLALCLNVLALFCALLSKPKHQLATQHGDNGQRQRVPLSS